MKMFYTPAFPSSDSAADTCSTVHATCLDYLAKYKY